MLSDAGFSRSQLVRTRQPLQTRLIVAHKAAAPAEVFIHVDISNSQSIVTLSLE